MVRAGCAAPLCSGACRESSCHVAVEVASQKWRATGFATDTRTEVNARCDYGQRDTR